MLACDQREVRRISLSQYQPPFGSTSACAAGFHASARICSSSGPGRRASTERRAQPRPRNPSARPTPARARPGPRRGLCHRRAEHLVVGLGEDVRALAADRHSADRKRRDARDQAPTPRRTFAPTMEVCPELESGTYRVSRSGSGREWSATRSTRAPYCRVPGRGSRLRPRGGRCLRRSGQSAHCGARGDTLAAECGRERTKADRGREERHPQEAYSLGGEATAAARRGRAR